MMGRPKTPNFTQWKGTPLCTLSSQTNTMTLLVACTHTSNQIKA